MTRTERLQESVSPVMIYLFPAVSGFVTIRYILGIRGEEWFSVLALIGCMLEYAKIRFTPWFVRNFSWRGPVLLVGALAVPLTLISMAATNSYLSSSDTELSKRHHKEQSIAVESTDRYRMALASWQSAQRAVEEANDTKKKLTKLDPKMASREADIQVIEAEERRDKYQKDLEEIRLEHEARYLPSSGGLWVFSPKHINWMIVVLLELCTFGFTCIEIERQRKRRLMSSTEVPQKGGPDGRKTKSSEKFYEDSSKNEEFCATPPAPAVVRGERTKRFSLKVVKGPTSSKKFSDVENEFLRQAINAIESGTCEPSYDAVQELLGTSRAGVSKLFDTMRSMGMLEKDGRRHVVREKWVRGQFRQMSAAL